MLLLARQWISSPSDAEDIVQEAFIRFWRSRERVSEPAGYLFACVKHVALDWQRCRRRQRIRDEVTARPEAEPLLSAPIEQDERRAAIEAALRALPENQAEVLVLPHLGRTDVRPDRRGAGGARKHRRVALPLCPGPACASSWPRSQSHEH